MALSAGLPPFAAVAHAQSGDVAIVEAREALRKKDRPRLAALRASALAERHPLAMWADYFDLNNRLVDAQQDELTAFFTRWSGTYVEDRLRNDWLLELGKRRDWANFATELPRFRMNDDREVACYAMLLDQQAGKDVRAPALAAWLAQREADDGCALLAAQLVDAKVFTAADVWRKARAATEVNRPRAVRQAVMLLSLTAAGHAAELMENPARYLATRPVLASRTDAELAALALARLAANDPEFALAQLGERWDRALPADLAAWAWAALGKQAALRLQPDAPDHFMRAALRATKDGNPKDGAAVELPDDTLAWKVRAALRADNGRARWQQVVQGVNAMSLAEQRDPAWIYWKARALQALAKDSQDGESMRALAQELLAGIAEQYHFYGKLAADNLGRTVTLPPRPPPPTAEERAAVASHPGLTRALQLIQLGLRNEGVREWNYSLRGMADRELLAAAQLACDREVWDRCINTSERTRTEIDMAQRFPTPFRKEVQAAAREIGLDPAYVFGLIRQESRFIMDARSTAGASGLMQLMPATARWTAKKIGLDYRADLINDRDTNLKLGTTYLKLVLDDFAGSQAMAAAAYNAGPNRPRKWREGPVLETAVWAENIPFAETRDYVKKVLSNSAYYAALMTGEPPALKARLGRTIGPRDPGAPASDKALP
ncbi:MAG: lytic transglycosylase [Methylibium sp. NZG]|nr:MAG: lytic transglycosylase [Methylibium sp. NZG]